MKITLLKLTLSNFKGLRQFILEPGDNCLIKGANATYKTTLKDGFLWLLFDKDSQGKSDFALKTLKDGQEIPNIDHSVEGIFDIDGPMITLKKVYKEVYTKKRGNSQADLTGHTTDHYIDGVPVQKKDWDQRISDLINEDTFKLLTSPTYFNSLHWEKRRSLLLEVCGDLSDNDVIENDKTLTALTEILGNRSIEDQKKVVAAKRKEINQRLNERPSRIDELDKSLTDVSGQDVDAIQAQIRQLDSEIQAMRDDATSANLRKQKAEFQAKLSELEVAKERAHREATKEIDDKVEALEKELGSKQGWIKQHLDEIARAENAIKFNEAEMTRLREQYAVIADKKADVTDACPTCGQSLPKDQVQDAIKKHNENQAWRLADINQKGKVLKNENARLTEKIEALTKKGLETEKEANEIEAKIKELKAKPVHVQFDVEKSEKIKAELQEIEKKLADSLPPNTGPLEENRKTLQAMIAASDAAKKTRARIEELKAEEKKLATEYEELERQISLIGKFDVAKVDMLDEKINCKFEFARFKLFEKQINGGIEPVCVTLYDGVPYGYGLNSGAEINVGLDIIKTLSEHYGIKAPVFIDHAESVTELLDPGTQTIKLMVSEDHPKMEVSEG